jgi:hypothetical protein
MIVTVYDVDAIKEKHISNYCPDNNLIWTIFSCSVQELLFINGDEKKNKFETYNWENNMMLYLRMVKVQ